MPKKNVIVIILLKNYDSGGKICIVIEIAYETFSNKKKNKKNT